MDKECRRAWVSGQVQGVWYRGSTQRQAQTLGITGWAKNLPDGRVEVLMCGPQEALDRLESWLHEGSPAAKVSHVDVLPEHWHHFNDFTTG